MTPAEEKARDFAIKAHGDQKYGEFPYSKHLENVVAVVKQHNLPEIVQVAAWLHDTLEDTETRYHQISNTFGVDVARLVWSVTNEHGHNRAERHRKTYPKIRANKLALALKLCDRIANLKFSLVNNDAGKVKMYLREHEEFVIQLYKREDWPDLWHELIDLVQQARSFADAASKRNHS